MNFHLMVKEYQESDIMSKVEGASKHEFIQIVLEELYNNLNILSDAITNDPIRSSRKSKSFGRIITSLMILTDSLDFKRGEPIASNLFNLYSYCKEQVLEDYKNRTVEGINSSASVIEDILSAWKEIK